MGTLTVNPYCLIAVMTEHAEAWREIVLTAPVPPACCDRRSLSSSPSVDMIERKELQSLFSAAGAIGLLRLAVVSKHSDAQRVVPFVVPETRAELAFRHETAGTTFPAIWVKGGVRPQHFAA